MSPAPPRPEPTNDNARPPGFWFVTVCGVGLLRPGPGTWGSLVAIPPALLVLHVAGIFGLIAALTVLSVAGFYVLQIYEKRAPAHDDPRIVLDEVIGMGIALLASGGYPVLVAFAFVLFRFFDIVKPGPIGWLDANLKGAGGVLADDILAGIAAALCVGAIRYAPAIG